MCYGDRQHITVFWSVLHPKTGRIVAVHSDRERERESYEFLPVPVAEAAPIDLVSLKGNAEPTVESQLPPPSTAFRQFSLPNPAQNVDHFSSPLPLSPARPEILCKRGNISKALLKVRSYSPDSLSSG